MIAEQKRTTKKRAKEHAEFRRLIEEIIVRFGAVPNITQSIYDWVLETQAGTLGISIQENLSEGPGSVMCRFSDPIRACSCPVFDTFVSINFHSGKWNHHFFSEWTQSSAAGKFQYLLSKIALDS